GKLMCFLTLDDLTGSIEITAFADTYDKYNQYIQSDAIVLIKGTVDFGTGRSKGNSSDDEEENPEPKLLAIAVAPIDNTEAIQVLQKASPRRRNGYGKNQSSPAIALPTFKPYSPQNNQAEVRQSPSPSEIHATPASDATLSKKEEIQHSCRLCLSEEFVRSEQFLSLPSLLQGCKGEAPLEITIKQVNGMKRCWRIPSINVDPKRIAQHLIVLGKATLDN
ncbi:MAG TPA: OB-fold nucleic acid binding domain-containing protein, partial [Armatimonadota bacterium]|nr:OB-fold nucleic acid binding domain-containing protein [Armatimonadota bacterium]